jgi:ABC-type antimicrobial peptide transport system permease subunit
MTDAESHARFAERNRRVAESIEALQQTAGVISAATFFAAPLGLGPHSGIPPRPDEPIAIEAFDGRARPGVRARNNSVGVDFVRAFGATIIAGKTFTDPEFDGQDHVAVINETLARQLSQPLSVMGAEVQQPVVGRRLRTQYFNGEVIGVIKDLVDTPALPPSPQFFAPDRHAGSSFGVAIRTTPSVATAMPAIVATLERTWGRLPSRQFTLMRDELNTLLVPYRGQSLLLSAIAGLCLPIAAIGLTGALTYSVRLRSREIAIRISLGAEPKAVRRSVVRRALTAVALGIGLGTALGVATGSVMAHQLLHVHPMDFPTIIGVTFGLMGLGWLAAAVPARDASRVEPASLLRQV